MGYICVGIRRFDRELDYSTVYIGVACPSNIEVE
jgi:hypothetical protein